MANQIDKVTIEPSTTKSGNPVTVTVSYKTRAAASGAIISSPGFDLSTDSFEVAPGATTTDFKLTITRDTSQNATCRLEFQLFTFRKIKRVTVT